MDVKSKQLRLIRNVKQPQTHRRKRMRPVRKWENSEITLLINFLLENREFEKPTQRLYYQNFIRHYDIDIPWDLIKGKVRNLRTKYEKLRDMYRCRDQGETLKENLDLIERSCPHFDKLAEIFDGKTSVSVKNEMTWETDVSMSQNQIMDHQSVAMGSLDSADIINSFSLAAENQFDQDTKIEGSSIPSASHQQLTITGVTENCNTDPLPENIPLPLSVTDIQPDLEILKFNFEKEKFYRRMTLKEKKFEFKVESVRKRVELKKMKLELDKMKVEKDFHLEKMRLEIDERITIKRLEMKGREAEAEI